MNAQTMTGCAALIRADDSLEARERMRLIALLKSGPRTETQTQLGPRVMPRAEVARTLGRSLRFVDGLARRGLLRRVKLRERKRAIGVRADDVLAFVESNTVAVGDDGKAVSK